MVWTSIHQSNRSYVKPCKRFVFIKKTKLLDFTGPEPGRRHQVIVYKNCFRLAIPSNKEYSVAQMKDLLGEISELLGRKITDREWESL